MSVYTETETTPAQPVTTHETVESDVPSSQTIRAWARMNNIPVGKRGPLAPELIVRYLQSRTA